LVINVTYKSEQNPTNSWIPMTVSPMEGTATIVLLSIVEVEVILKQEAQLLL